MHSFKYLDKFKDKLIERYLGKPSLFNEHQLLSVIKQTERESVASFASRVRLGVMYTTRRAMMGEAKLTHAILLGNGVNEQMLKYTQFMTAEYLSNIQNAAAKNDAKALPFAYLPLEGFIHTKRLTSWALRQL